MTESAAYLGITFGSCNILNSSVASRPAYNRIAFSPPGWSGKKDVTSRTWPFTTTQTSSFLLCLATSSRVNAFVDDDDDDDEAAAEDVFFSSEAEAVAG